MTKLLTSAAFAAALIAAPAAFAATGQAAAAPKPAPASTAHAKKAECVKQWKAQKKKHAQSEKEFLAACEKA